MNIFALDNNPVKCAEYMVDKHILKMTVETCQLLSTAHRICDGTMEVQKINGRSTWVYTLPDSMITIYKATHRNHPSTIWARATNNNYNWLYVHFLALLDEYTYRYGKVHACSKLKELLKNPPRNIPFGPLMPFATAMDMRYIVPNDPVQSYRNYYRTGKSHLHSWTKRNKPEWILENKE